MTWVTESPIGAHVAPFPERDMYLYPSVRAAFLPFIDEFEGHDTWMYLDELGLVTTGHGNLIDSPGAALALSWVWVATGAPASDQAVQAEWTRVKSLQAMRGRGGGAFRRDARLVVTPDSLQALVDRTLAHNEELLRARFPRYDTAPGDAMLALHRMAWAMGPAFVDRGRWPAFHAAFLAQDWLGCSRECRMSEVGQPHEFVLANDAVQQLFRNAAEVEAMGFDRTVLYYPRRLDVQAADTIPPPPGA